MGINNEGAVITRILIEATKNGWRLFRNSVGLAWQGRPTEEYSLAGRSGESVHVVELAGARRVQYGLCRGSSDLIGWRPLVITADMVGQTVAQFVAIEAKTAQYSRTTAEQDNFLDQVSQAGGFAAVARGTNSGEVMVCPVEVE